MRALNVVGMRRAGLSSEARGRIAQAYRILHGNSRSQDEASLD